MPEHARRRLLSTAGSSLLRSTAGLGLLGVPWMLAQAATLRDVRVWPARDYTRVTLELDAPLAASYFTVSDPPRVVVDFEGIDLNAALRDLVARVRPDDPYIAGVRIGQNRPGVTRLVIDLKTPVQARLFALAPVERYGHRVVIDLHPAQSPDPIEELLRQNGQARQAVPPNPAAGSAGDPLGDWLRRRDAAAASTVPALAPSAAPASAPPSGAAGADRRAGPAGGMERLITIAIDPGHGGEDPGAIGPAGTMEKDVVLAIAQRLRERLLGEPGMRVLMTRDADYFVPLAVRVSKARAVSADLFVSIHADAFTSPLARGSSVFVLSEQGASSVGARWLAAQENRADQIGGVDLRRGDREVSGVLIDLSTTAQIQSSRRLGNALLGELAQLGPMHKPAVEQAAFAVLKAPDIASVLVETAFISHPEEEEKLRDPDFQNRAAAALHAGIRAYLRAHPPTRRGPAA